MEVAAREANKREEKYIAKQLKNEVRLVSVWCVSIEEAGEKHKGEVGIVVTYIAK